MKKKRKRLQIKCVDCQRYLKVPGALLFSPPDVNGMVKKFHLCTSCWTVISDIYE